MTKHIIVDGSNIATEGRSVPSLAQLHEAVMALMDEFKNAKVSVVVDATFGHRIAKKESAEFEKAIANNELVAPPAGAVGRGDAFVLAIADKVNASILSNDSYQEFHGKYKWLFDEGRLIGGKPVPLVGWVFVERLPVRGATSRRSVKTGKVVKKESSTASPEASKPMPVPKSPPPSVKAKMANALMPYLQFVEKHPVGSKVKAVVESYAANGITALIGDISGYVPLRNMATPQPRSARDIFTIGDAVTLTVVGYTPARRSVDLAVPGVVGANTKTATKPAQAKSPAVKKASPAKKAVAAKTAPAKKVSVAKKAAPIKKAVVAKAPAKKVAAKKVVAAKAPAKKTVAKKAPVKRR
ncbi:unannotated protein [freshwater metagenome]|uniref:Unannotated protein n=1 Tax=freshwater metagenome TaxID=449393 RepID=A0A6J6MX80_9ZZZZ